jgi:hypothetical protein
MASFVSANARRRRRHADLFTIMKSLLALLIATSLLAGCASKKKEEKPGPTGQATLIGMIEMVNPEQNYVLIRCEPMPSLNAGAELIALGANGARSKLVLSPERKGHYLTADIKEGQPEVTNLVLVQHTPVPEATTPTAAPATTPTTPPEATSAYQPMPSLPGMLPAASGSAVPTLPLEPTLPVITKPATPPTTEAPAKGFGDLEPPVGGKP